MKGYKYKLHSKPQSANNFNKLVHLYKKISHPKYLQENDEKKKPVVKNTGGSLLFPTHLPVLNKNLFKNHYVIGKGGFGRV